MNLFEIPLEPGADLRFDSLIDCVSSSSVKGESNSVRSSPFSSALATTGCKSISPPKKFSIFSALLEISTS